ncbi:MAG: hypothetical protein CR965_02065 [Paludibacter sp.]|nr:MAG: hypothetical protein CR965_02065 [Paludibacter sp.]
MNLPEVTINKNIMIKLLLKNRIPIYLLLMSLFFGGCSVFKPLKNQGQPEVIDYFFTDEQGNKIDAYSISPKEQKYICMMIITKNLIGTEVTLDIEQDEAIESGFICKGKYVNKSIRFKIRKNKEKIKLFIYDPENKRHVRLKEKSEKLEN